MPPLHPMIIHFPIALFILAVLFDFITAYRVRHIPRGDRKALRQEIHMFDPATRLLMALGFVGALAAVATGEWLKVQRGALLPHTLLELHQTLAIVFTIWYGGLVFFRLQRRWIPSKLYLSCAVIGFFILVAVGHTGGTMAWPALKKIAVTASVAPNSATLNSTVPQNTTVSQNTTDPNGSVSADSNTTLSPKSSPAVSDKMILKVGDSSPQVRTLQQQLSKLGYFHHVFTEYYGAVTATAVKEFQNDHHLPATGNLDEITLTHIQEALSQDNTRSTTTGSASSSHPSSSTTSGGSSANTHTSNTEQVRLQKGYHLFINDCQSCHSLGMATQYFGKLSDSQWVQVMNQMQGYARGAIPNTQTILYYLEHQHT